MIGFYIRVSTDESAQKGYSTKSQIEACKEKIGSDEYIPYVDDAVSGELLWERPALSKLRQDIENGLITKVVCLDPDRLARKLVNQLIIDDFFNKYNIEIVYVSSEYAQTPEGRLFYSMRGAISEFEKAKIKERTKRGMQQKIKDGKLFRYDNILGYDSDGNDGYSINKHETDLVQKIFNMFTIDRFSYNGIATRLRDSGYDTKKGGQWSPAHIRYILSNSTYVGKKIQNKIDASGVSLNKFRDDAEKIQRKIRPENEWTITHVPTIIKEEQFFLAQELMKNIKAIATSRRYNKYLLSGLLKCNECGRNMVGHTPKYISVDGEEISYPSYVCPSRRKGCGRRVMERDIEPIIWEWVINFLQGSIKLEEQSLQVEINELEVVLRKIDKLENGRKRLIKLVAIDDTMNLDDVHKEIAGISDEITQLTNRKNALKNIIKKPKSNNVDIFSHAKHLFRSKEEHDFESKEQIIHLLIKKIVIQDDLDFFIDLH